MKLLPRQTTPYTCGPACLVAVNRLVGTEVFYEHDIAEELGALPGIGVDHNDLTNWSIKHTLPVNSHGEHTYKGGVAIANIKNPVSHIGHFVIMLGVRNNIYRYYCPLFGEVFEKHGDDILWENMNGELKHWAVSFDSDVDYYDTHIEAEQHIFILGDSKDTLQPEYDTSLLLLDAYRKMGQSVSWATPDEIYTRAQLMHLSGIPVLKNDIVWLRTDPVNSVFYYEMLRRLAHMKAHILNNPRSVVGFHDKLSALYIDANNFCTASTEENVKKCLRHLKVMGKDKFVVKSPSLFGGKNVILCQSEEEVYHAFSSLVVDSGYVIIQGFVDTGARQMDRRVLTTPHKIIGTMDRVAKDGDFLCNIHAGASVQKSAPLTEKQKEHVANIQNFMLDNNLFLAGIDLLGDTPIEVNITCPSGVPQMNAVNDKQLELDLIDAAWEWTKTGDFRTHLPIKE